MELFIKRNIPPTWKLLSNRKKNPIYNKVGLCSIKFRFWNPLNYHQNLSYWNNCVMYYYKLFALFGEFAVKISEDFQLNNCFRLNNFIFEGCWVLNQSLNFDISTSFHDYLILITYFITSHVFAYFFKVQTSVSYNFPKNFGTFTAKTPNHFKIPFTLHIAVLQFWLSTCFTSVAMMILHFTFLHSCIFFKVSAYPLKSKFDYCHNFLSHGP